MPFRRGAHEGVAVSIGFDGLIGLRITGVSPKPFHGLAVDGVLLGKGSLGGNGSAHGMHPEVITTYQASEPEKASGCGRRRLFLLPVIPSKTGGNGGMPFLPQPGGLGLWAGRHGLGGAGARGWNRPPAHTSGARDIDPVDSLIRREKTSGLCAI